MDSFNPTQAQRLAKARLKKWAASGESKMDPRNLNPAALATITKSPNLVKWASDPEFMDYLFDSDDMAARIGCLAELTLDRLYEILTSPIEGGRDATITANHVLAAAKQVIELAALAPKQERKVVFADKEVEALDAEATQKEIEAIKLQLIGK
jgi:hypothetical protein